MLHRANDALRKQVALKQDFSRVQCVSLAAALASHVLIMMLCLHEERLWQRLLFTTPSPVPQVCQLQQAILCCIVLVSLAFGKVLCLFPLQFWTALFWVMMVDQLVRHFGMIIKVDHYEKAGCRLDVEDTSCYVPARNTTATARL